MLLAGTVRCFCRVGNMIVRHFLQWVRTAPAAERADATGALARAYLYSDLSPDDPHTYGDELRGPDRGLCTYSLQGGCRSVMEHRRVGDADYRALG